ncbi:MAG: class I SAM-dependent methyltransferase [Bacteroidetes bacterium]|nr:MAG: class I SAM-dependent methyltransferase [Bacteroidota bacterium]
MAQQEIDEILKINERQKAFYNKNQYEGLPSRLWGRLRDNIFSAFRDQHNIKTLVYDTHKEWLGDLSGKKVLDLGCLEGNKLSFYMAEHAADYLGIDLSENAMEVLRARLDKKGLTKARVMAVDFLSNDFAEKDFDVIYAYSVLHHFPNMGMLVGKLKEKLKPGGIIISYDPTETSLPVKVARMAYRPFQNDADWEWPFTKKTLLFLHSAFKVEAMHGILGKAKYTFLYNLLPLSKTTKQKTIKKAVDRDWNANKVNSQLLSCMHVTMLMRHV